VIRAPLGFTVPEMADYFGRFTVASTMLGKCILMGLGTSSKHSATDGLGKDPRKHG